VSRPDKGVLGADTTSSSNPPLTSRHCLFFTTLHHGYCQSGHHTPHLTANPHPTAPGKTKQIPELLFFFLGFYLFRSSDWDIEHHSSTHPHTHTPSPEPVCCVLRTTGDPGAGGRFCGVTAISNRAPPTPHPSLVSSAASPTGSLPSDIRHSDK